jgi:hypothetical protein
MTLGRPFALLDFDFSSDRLLDATLYLDELERGLDLLSAID